MSTHQPHAVEAVAEQNRHEGGYQFLVVIAHWRNGPAEISLTSASFLAEIMLRSIAEDKETGHITEIDLC
jgi:hypothetical protein